MSAEKLFSHFKEYNGEEIQTVKKIVELCEASSKSHRMLTTAFLPPIFKKIIPEILRSYEDLDFLVSGGYEDAEYFKVMVYPGYTSHEMAGIKVIKSTFNSKYGSLGHRDVLGALMGLGIKRQLIGDILVKDSTIQILVDEDMGAYIAAQLDKIGKVKVSSQLMDLDTLVYEPVSYEYSHQTVSSLRLDTIISSAFNMSRSKVVEAIKSEKVKLNHRVETSTSKLVVEKDLVSFRGQGRFILDEVLGLSKKDRQKIIIKKYV